MELIVYDNAKRAIAEYKTVDEVKNFRDKALAVEAYAKQAMDMELEWDAARARVRAERRCGELLRELEKAKGNQHVNSARSNRTTEQPKTLAQMGITKDQSSKFQRLAAVPEAEFEAAVEMPGLKPSTNHIIKEDKPEPPRMDADALWLWGLLRDMRGRDIFSRPIQTLVDEWTDGMVRDAGDSIHQLKRWVNNDD